ncbi:MAG TPA: FAD-dependent oxidoreductase [Bacillota bacterium]|nr:FAD-dependent oxidoreductase [Bacillota bacterium]
MTFTHASLWQKAHPFPSFPTLESDIDCEVLIVGAGITGLLTAYELRKIGLQVVVIDSHEIASGTTGRTTAKITAQHGLIYHSLIESSGIDQAQEYYETAIMGKNALLQTAADLQMNIALEHKDSVIYTTEEMNVQKIVDEFHAYERLHIPGSYTDNIDFPIETKAAITMLDQSEFDPLSYLLHIVEDLVDDGVTFYEHTQAVDLEQDEKIYVHTHRDHKITSTYVVQASHFPFYDPLGMFTTRLIPERSFVYTGKNHSLEVKDMYISCDQPLRSFRSTTVNNEDYFLIAGEGYIVGKDNDHTRPYEALTSTANTLFPNHTFVSQWSAQDYNTMDSIPYIGRLKNKNENIFVATGFKKWGMTTSATAALLIADLIQKRPNPHEEMYAPSRFDVSTTIPSFLKQNTHVASQLVKGKVSSDSKDVEDLKKHEATTVFKRGKKLGIYKDQDEQIHVIDTTCTHLGCEVEWNPHDYTWDCPCHGSRYMYNGTVIEGPAKKSLQNDEL